jgi:hypothetical protein
MFQDVRIHHVEHWNHGAIDQWPDRAQGLTCLGGDTTELQLSREIIGHDIHSPRAAKRPGCGENMNKQLNI